MRDFLAVYVNQNDDESIDVDLNYYTSQADIDELIKEFVDDLNDGEDHYTVDAFQFSEYKGFDDYEPSSLNDAIEVAQDLSRERDDDVVSAYLAFMADTGNDFRSARDAFYGVYDSVEDFAEHTANELGMGDIPDWVLSAVDWSQAWKSSLSYDYTEYDVGRSVAIFNKNY